MRASARIKITYERSQVRFRGRYRRCELHVEWDRRARRNIGAWYIMVIAPNGAMAFDGWWMEAGANIDDAIEAALRGAGLI